MITLKTLGISGQSCIIFDKATPAGIVVTYERYSLGNIDYTELGPKKLMQKDLSLLALPSLSTSSAGIIAFLITQDLFGTPSAEVLTCVDLLPGT